MYKGKQSKGGGKEKHGWQSQSLCACESQAKGCIRGQGAMQRARRSGQRHRGRNIVGVSEKTHRLQGLVQNETESGGNGGQGQRAEGLW